MYYTKYELDLIHKAKTSFMLRYGSVVDDFAQSNLASVQFHVQGQLMGIYSPSDTMAYRIIAAKLSAECDNPLEFILDTDYSELLQLDIIKKLWPRYSENSSGLGYWNNWQHESVLWSIMIRHTANIPIFIRTAFLTSLRDIYNDQEQEAIKAKELTPTKKTQKIMVDGRQPELLSSISMEERKQAAAFGNCYRCSAPKARSLPCRVCGYMPRGVIR